MRTKTIPICVTKQSSKVLLDVGAYGSLRRTSVLWIGQIIVLYLIGHVVGLWTSWPTLSQLLRAAVPVNYAANSLLTPNLHLHTKNIKQKIHTLGTLCNPLLKKPIYTTLPPPLHPPHRALVPYRPFPLTYEQHTETSTTRKILGFRQHRFFFFYSVGQFLLGCEKTE